MKYRISSMREECSNLILPPSNLHMFKLNQKEAYEINQYIHYNHLIPASGEMTREERISIIAKEMDGCVRKENGFYTMLFDAILPLQTKHKGFVLLCDDAFEWMKIIYIDGFIMELNENPCEGFAGDFTKAYIVIGRAEKMMNFFDNCSNNVIDAIINQQKDVELSEEEVKRLREVLGIERFCRNFHKASERRRRQEC